MKRTYLKLTLIALCLSIHSCSNNLPTIKTEPVIKTSISKTARYQIKGIVQFPGSNFKTKYFRIKDNLADISTASTISLVKPSESRAV